MTGQWIHEWLAALCCAVCLAGAGSVHAADSKRPLGAWFGLYQTITFTDEILWPLDLHAQVHYYRYDPALLDRYGAVLIGAGSSDRKQLTDDESAALGAWVESGGLLIVTGVEGHYLFGDEPPAWTGRQSWRAGPAAAADAELPLMASDPDAPLLRGIDVAALAGAKANCLVGPEQGTTLVGRGPRALIWKHPHGKGQVLYLGGALTPQIPKPRDDDKTIVHQLTPAAVALWGNLIDVHRLPTRGDAIAAWGRGRQTPLVAWDRYQVETPLGAAAYIHPYPQDESEQVTQVTMDLGQGERSWKPLFLTSLAADDAVRISTTELRSEAGDVLPAGSVRVLAQVSPPLAPVMNLDIVMPEKGISPYWLVDLPSVPPLGQEALKMEADRAYTLWLESHADARAAAGVYEGALRFEGADGRMLLSLAVRLRVWPVRAPGGAEMDFEMEHLLGSLPGGSFIDKVPYLAYDRERLTRSIQGIARLGVNVVQDYGYINGVHGRRFARLRETGQPLVDAIKENPSFFESQTLPDLEFSDYARAYLDPAIRAGLTTFATNQLLGEFLSAGQRGSPEQGRLIAWYFGQFTRTLRERGFIDVYAKATDELSVEQLPTYISTAKVFQQAGYQLYTTAYNFMYQHDAVLQADPVMDMWQIEPLAEPWPKVSQRLWGRTVAAGEPMWHLHTGSVWGNYIDYPRAAGWAAALGGARGVHVHGYLRWRWSQFQGALPGPDGIFPAVTNIVYANSMTGGRYLAQLIRLLDEAKSAGCDVSDIESDLARTVGAADGALLHIGVKPSGLAKQQGAEIRLFDLDSVDRNPRKNIEVKRRILEMTARLAERRRPQPTVRYGEAVLVEQGKLMATIVADEAAQAAPLLKWMADQLDIKAAVQATPADETPLAIVVGTAESPLVKALVKADAPGAITPAYPQAGDYAILRWSNAEGRLRIVVVGRDAEGATRGAEALVHFFEIKDSIR